MIDSRLVTIALTGIDRFDFEDFAKAMSAAAFGVDFVPAGGHHDGGLDGFHATADGDYYQFSTSADAEKKIRGTIRRISETRGSLAALDYLTSITVPNKDLVAKSISKDTKTFVRIFDAEWIQHNINLNAQSEAAFKSYLAPHLDYLREFGRSFPLHAVDKEQKPSLYVFLQQEYERLSGHQGVTQSVIDSLIKWALEGTDPEKGIFKTRQEIHSYIVDSVPKTNEILNEQLTARLHALSQKDNPGGRGIRHHTKDDQYCLPYSLRSKIEEEAFEDAILRIRFDEVLSGRLSDAFDKVGLLEKLDAAIDVTHRVIHQVMSESCVNILHLLQKGDSEKSGLDFSSTLEPTCVEQFGKSDETHAIIDVIKEVIAKAFYHGADTERRYLSKISQAYLFQVFLKFDPNAIRHFDELSKNLKLVIGTDILVRVMTEVYLEEADQGTTSLLKKLAENGAKLILTEPVVDEVWNNLKSANREYNADFEEVYQHLTWTIASQPKKILVRSFLYAVLEARRIGDRLYWPNFIEKFCSLRDIESHEGRRQIQDFFEVGFAMNYYDREALKKIGDQDVFDELLRRFLVIKEDENLAENDALLISFIYGLRKREADKSTKKFGFVRWWLTEESKVVREASTIIQRNGEFALRPDFLFYFLGLVTSSAEAKIQFQALAMSAMGIRLSNRVASDLVDSTLKQVAELKAMNEARYHANLAELNRKVQAEHRKSWDRNRSDT